MKIKLHQVLGANKQINNLLKVGFDTNISWKISTMLRKLQPELEQYEVKRKAIIEEFCDKDENNKPKLTPSKDEEGKDTQTYSFSKEVIEDYTKKMIELSEVEIDLNFEPIKIEDIKDTKVPAKDLVDWMFI